MLTFIIRRILALIPLLFIVSVIVYGLILIVPGDPAITLAGGEEATNERIEEVQQELGLDRPFLVRYGEWVGNAVQLDFGNSLYSDIPITEEIAERFPKTLQIAGGALAFGLLVGIPLGIISGIRPRSVSDRTVVIITSAAIAIPTFWLALILILQLAVYRSILPSRGFVPFSEAEILHLADELRHLIVRDLAVVAEVDGKPVGTTFALLDYNPRVRAIGGRLLPFGLFRLLWNKRAIKNVRLVTANVVPEFQAWGIGLVLLDALVPAVLEWGIREAEFSWILESNQLSRGSLERGGAIRTKTWRMYQDDQPA